MGYSEQWRIQVPFWGLNTWSRQVGGVTRGVFQKHKWRVASKGYSKEISICAVLKRVCFWAGFGAAQRSLSPALSCAGTIPPWPTGAPSLGSRLLNILGLGQLTEVEAWSRWNPRVRLPPPPARSGSPWAPVTVSHRAKYVSVHLCLPLLAVLLLAKNCCCQASWIKLRSLWRVL